MDYGDGTVELPSLGSMEITFNTLELGRRLVPVRKAKVYWEGGQMSLTGGLGFVAYWVWMGC